MRTTTQCAVCLLLLAGCIVGPRISRLDFVRTGQGIQAAVTARTDSALGLRLAGELLAVEPGGLLLLTDRNAIVRIGYGDIDSTTFSSLKRLNWTGGAPPADVASEIRLLSRFPQGVSEELMAALLETHGQDSVRTMP